MQTLSQDTQPENFQALMQLWKKLFIDHPAEGGETYFEHFFFTVGMSTRFIIVSAILLTHGILPFTFTRTASRHIEKIYSIMRTRAAKMCPDNIEQYDI